MKNRTRLLTISLITATAAIAVTGCSVNTSSTSTSSSSPSASATTTGAALSKMGKLGAELRAGKPVDVPTAEDFGGFPAVVSRVPTSDKVVFITIDDGYGRPANVANLLRRIDLPVTSFLTADTVAQNTEYFAEISQRDGQVIQNHSINHPQMPNLSEAGQKTQICTTSDKFAQWFGTRPWMFRPPYGEYNDTTRKAAAQCGIDYLAMWTVSLPTCCLRYAEGNSLKPGDIILTHWREDLALDLLRTFNDIKDQGFRVAALEDYLPKQ